jgi:Zn-dependent M28 family amino/carboxypeptidase
VALAAALSNSCSNRSDTADRWWSHVRWLADDAREGRGTGTRGYRAAADYVAREFRTAGAIPGGTSGFLQPIQFVGRRIRESECLLALVHDGRADTLELGQDANFSTTCDPPDSLEADAVFVGFGLQIPEYGHDDLAGIDLRGKIAVFLRGGPPSLPANVRAYAQHQGVRWRRLRAAGAIGFVTLSDPATLSLSWERYSRNRLTWGYGLADTALDEHYGERFKISVNPARAQKFFEGTGHSFDSLVVAARRGDPLPRFPLARRIRARVRIDRRVATSPNVVGIIRGTDPRLRRESVILSAHLDHLGIGSPDHGDSIYNGAMDNASGVATLIEIARALGQAEHRPKRSIVLLALAAEEEGLLGSWTFAKRPPRTVGKMVANVNLDMFLPIIPLRATIAYGVDESTLGDRYRAVADSADVALAPDTAPEQTYFIRSDQFSFVRAGVPALFFEFGALPGDSAQAKQLRQWMQRYHAPSDDARQPVDLKAAAAFNRLLTRFTEDVANAPERPMWHEDSFFARFARGQAAR